MALVSVVLLTTTDNPAGVAERLEPGRQARILVREPDDPNVASGVPRGEPDAFGVACELRADSPSDLLAAAAKLRDGLGEGIDPSRSIALAGTDHVMLPGSGPAVLIYALRGLPALTLPEFHHYWITTHAEFGRRALAGQGYRQVHADPKLSAELAQALGIAGHDLDGAVVSESTSWDSYWQRRTNPEARKTGSEALADEDNFIDHTRSMSMRYTELIG
jgi:hypothetical protein